MYRIVKDFAYYKPSNGAVKTIWRCRGLNPGPFTCKANALPLSYIPAAGKARLNELGES